MYVPSHIVVELRDFKRDEISVQQTQRNHLNEEDRDVRRSRIRTSIRSKTEVDVGLEGDEANDVQYIWIDDLPQNQWLVHAPKHLDQNLYRFP